MSKAWCPKCKNFKKFNTDKNCTSCKLEIVYLSEYIGSNNEKQSILVDKYEKGDKYYD
jgi:hypothetical protein